MIFCTLARKEQLANAFVLAKSVRSFHPKARIVLCLAEHHVSANHTSLFDEVVIVTNNGQPFDSAESCCAAKAYLLKLLLASYADDKIIYLDPEMKLFASFKRVEQLLDQHDIIATPYHLEPCDMDDYGWEIERLQNGFLHAGFVALRSSETGRRFSQWWSRHIDESFYGPSKDGWADHKWLSLAMVPFQIYLLKDPSFHVAAWNVHASGRTISLSSKGHYMIHGQPLRSFHFMNTDGMLDRRLGSFIPDHNMPVYQLLQSYREELELANQSLS